MENEKGFIRASTITRCRHYIPMDPNDQVSRVCDECEKEFTTLKFQVSEPLRKIENV